MCALAKDTGLVAYKVKSIDMQATNRGSTFVKSLNKVKNEILQSTRR